MLGAETLDHIAFPVRDLPRAEKFYLEVVGLTFLTQRKNADGSPRHTYVKAGDNIIGLNLPGIQTEASPSGAPRYAIAVGSEANFHAIIDRIKQADVVCSEICEHSNDSPLLRAFRFTDFDNNHMEICMNRHSLGDICLSHVVLEATNLERTTRFYAEALGLRPVGKNGDEVFFEFPNHQLLGIKPVAALSDRTKRHGRAVHVAFNVSQDDFDRNVGTDSDSGRHQPRRFSRRRRAPSSGRTKHLFFRPGHQQAADHRSRRRGLVAHFQ